MNNIESVISNSGTGETLHLMIATAAKPPRAPAGCTAANGGFAARKLGIAMFIQSGCSLMQCKQLIDLIDSLHIQHLILIVGKTVLHKARGLLATCTIMVEIIRAAFFYQNPTKHVMSAKHEIISQLEFEQECVHRFGAHMPIDKLPKLLYCDAVRIYYGFDAHDIIRITRKNGYIAYRQVVEDTCKRMQCLGGF